MSQQHAAINRSINRSARCVLEMLHDMGTLVHNQGSAASILCYITAAYNYKIDKLIIGSHPYPDPIVPINGAAYSQRPGTQATPSIRVIQDYFHYKGNEFVKDVGNCVMEFWKTLTGGYLWVNSVYALPMGADNDVDTIRRVEATIEFNRILLVYQSKTYRVSKVEVLTFGTNAAYIGTNLCRRLSYNYVKCTIIRCDQPAKYARITHNRDKVGRLNAYMCLTARALKFIEVMVRVYRCVQRIAIYDIRNKMPSSIYSLISSGIKSLCADAQELVSNPPAYTTPSATSSLERRVESLERALASEVQYSRKANKFIQALPWQS